VVVGAQFGTGIMVIDPTTQSLLYTLPTVDGVRPLALTKDGRTFYAALSNLIGFVVADVEKGVTRRVELGTLPEGVPRPYLDTFTHALHLTPDETELWVTDCVNDLIRIVRVSDMRETAQIRVGHFPHWFALRPDGRVLFVSLWYSDAVAAIDVAGRRVLANIQFARQSGPKRIAIAPKVR
jgi:YVTN family beta-propeller protein